MRRILIIGDYPPPYGGVSVQVASLAHQLTARGDTEVRVVDIGARRRETRPGCLPARGSLALAATILSHVRGGFTPHVHTNGHNLKSWLVTLGCTTTTLAGGRRALVSLGSGLLPAYLATAGSAVRALARVALSAAGAIIVRNERSRAALTSIGIAPWKIVVQSGFYGVAMDEIGALPADVAEFRRQHDPLIGVIASCGPEYGLALMLDAAARLRAKYPRLGVLFVGPDRLEDGCPVWALPVGECERPAMLSAMQRFDVFVRPTYFDGDALSIREAQALGIRVVASETDFRPGGVWLFPCGDADALAAAIDNALSGPARRVESTSLSALLGIYDSLPTAAAPAATRRRDRDGVRVG